MYDLYTLQSGGKRPPENGLGKTTYIKPEKLGGPVEDRGVPDRPVRPAKPITPEVGKEMTALPWDVVIDENLRRPAKVANDGGMTRAMNFDPQGPDNTADRSVLYDQKNEQLRSMIDSLNNIMLERLSGEGLAVAVKQAENIFYAEIHKKKIPFDLLKGFLSLVKRIQECPQFKVLSRDKQVGFEGIQEAVERQIEQR